MNERYLILNEDLLEQKTQQFCELRDGIYDVPAIATSFSPKNGLILVCMSIEEPNWNEYKEEYLSPSMGMYGAAAWIMRIKVD